MAEAVRTAPPRLVALPLSVGIEYLPPAHGPASRNRALSPWTPRRDEGFSVEDASPPRASTQVSTAARSETSEFWRWSEDRLATIADPLERTTLMFLHGLMGEDRRRMQRELGAPLLAGQHIDLQSRLLESLVDPQSEEEQARFMSRNGHSLLKRPLRRALKNTSFIRDLELVVEDFKAENVITSHAYREHNDGIDWGHVSVRVRPTSFDEPLELTYKLRGFRVGASSQKVRFAWSERLSDRLHLHIRTRHVYGSGHTSVRGDLIWDVDTSTVMALVLGDDLEFLASSDAYSFFESPMDGAPGVLVYAQTIF